jgi:selenocysteine-specific elongation factor
VARLTLGTAGHVDHGKTALVAALTGVDTDRLAEEKARGISIELGYAPLRLPSGRELSVVDVPGHERFVRTMVAGATGVDLFLLTVAADDGVMPQTREHLAILGLLDVRAGVVALTKRDAVDDELAALAEEDARALMAAADLAAIPVVRVSARTGDGLDDLLGALDAAAASAPAGRPADGPVRLPVDRAFTLRGIGTVVTGTLWSGEVRVGDRLAIAPDGPAARVRSVQVHDAPVEAAAAGQRVAVALTGVERRAVRRGQWLVDARAPGASYRLECRLVVPEPAGRPLRHGERVAVHHGTAESPARVVLRGAAELAPGAAGTAQLRLVRPLLAAAGDRVVVRRTSPPGTAAGGPVLDPAPPRTHRAGPLGPARPAPAPGPPPQPVDAAAVEALHQRLAADPFSPPALAAGDGDALRALVASGRAVRAGRDHAFTAEAFAAATRAAVALAAGDGSLTLAALRDRLGCSRRHAQAILEALDAAGVTRRVGDARVLRRRGREAAAQAPR